MKGKGCLIAVIVVIVLMAIIAGIIYLQRGKLLEVSMAKMVDQMMSILPPDYDKAMARQTMDNFIEAVKEDRVDEKKIREVGEIFQAVMADKKLEMHEVDQLLEAMREAIK
jgi:hypothetical protein